MQVAPAEAAWAVVGVEMEAAPRGQEMERARGSVEFLGRWHENQKNRAMPLRFRADEDADGTGVRVGFGKFVDELVRQGGASSGILAISNWKEKRGPHEVTVSEVSWSASPDDVSYQRHGFVGMQSDQSINVRFADFEGVVDDFGDRNQMAVYRVTLPSRGLDPEKWVGRPPPPAPEELYTGPRSDGLRSTDEISGDYSAACACVDHGFPVMCSSMSVVPLGADAIETWRASCCFLPPFIGPTAEGAARTRNPGTNAFRNPQNRDPNNKCGDMTFSADGTVKQGCGGYKKRRTSQKLAFHKVETGDLAGKWCGCVCVPFVPCWPLAHFRWTEKTALNQDRYEESGHCCCLALPLPCSVESTTRTRVYVNGHPTNGFYDDGTWYRDYGGMRRDGNPDHIEWHRDAGCAGDSCSFAKKVG